MALNNLLPIKSIIISVPDIHNNILILNIVLRILKLVTRVFIMYGQQELSDTQNYYISMCIYKSYVVFTIHHKMS